MYWEYYLLGIILLPAIILGIWAQSRVSINFNKYSKVMSDKGLKAFEVARLILDSANLQDVQVVKVNGELTDNYNPKTKVVSLSSTVYDSSSVAAIGVATHEVGHAIQYAKNYFPAKIRTGVVVVSNLTSMLLWPLVIIGLILDLGYGSFAGNICMWSGVAIFGLAVIFNLITLPVEFNASNRAKAILSESEILSSEEMVGVNKVLNAAALTYVASTLLSILNLVRYLMVVMANRDN